MLPVVEIFTSIQGEGQFTGVPSIFVRVGGCNLRCVFKDSICDTPYASFTPERGLYDTMENLVKAFKAEREAYPHVHHVVITGGEPLMYKNDLDTFLKEVFEDDMVITIETNGSKPILNPLNGKYRIALYSVSPKLSTSAAKQPGEIQGIKVTQEMIDRHNKQRINIANLVDIVTSSHYQFKFVYSGPECIDEIRSIYQQMADYVKDRDDQFVNFYLKNHPNHNTMLMPEGILPNQLDAHSEEIADVCVQNGWTYTDRIQIRIWGDKRGV